MSAFLMKCRTFYGGNDFYSAIFNRLAQRASRGVYAATDIANVINRPTLAFADHQHFVLPGLVALSQFHS